jgi:ABC-type dipeptide/oligopeptide/nickel transport system permease component
MFIIGGTIIAVSLVMLGVLRRTTTNDLVQENTKYTFATTMIAMIIAVVVGVIMSIYGGVSSGVRLVKGAGDFVVHNPEVLMGG